jgi:HEAT repeat protein
LANLKSAQALEALIQLAIRNDTDPICRASAAAALAAIDFHRALPILQSLLQNDPNPLVQTEVLRLIKENSLR